MDTLDCDAELAELEPTVKAMLAKGDPDKIAGALFVLASQLAAKGKAQKLFVTAMREQARKLSRAA